MFVPLGVISAFIIADLWIQMKAEMIEYVFSTVLIAEAAYMTYEGTKFIKNLDLNFIFFFIISITFF